MAALIWPNAVRFSINGTYGGRNVANVFDMRIDDVSVGAERDDAIFDQAGDILNAWTTNLLPIVVNDYTALSVSWVDLNSATGTTGTRSSTADETWPQNGATSSDPTPGNVAALITKVAPGGGRRSRNGRLYVVGVSETQTDNTNAGNLTSTAVGQYTTAMEAFSSDISNTLLADGYSSNMTVLRTINQGTPSSPDIVAVGNDDVTAMVCQQRLATQRRRLRG